MTIFLINTITSVCLTITGSNRMLYFNYNVFSIKEINEDIQTMEIDKQIYNECYSFSQ